MATEAHDFPKISDQITSSRAHNPIQKDVESSEITEELPSRRHSHGRRKNLILEIPSRTLDETREDFLRTNHPPNSSLRSQINEFQGPSSTKNKPTIKTHIPKRSFKLHNMSSDVISL